MSDDEAKAQSSEEETSDTPKKGRGRPKKADTPASGEVGLLCSVIFFLWFRCSDRRLGNYLLLVYFLKLFFIYINCMYGTPILSRFS